MTPEAIVARIPGARKAGRGWSARCPAHNDKSPSLSITAGTDGRTILHCFSGCDIERITAALKLSVRDLFNDPTQLASQAYRNRGRRSVPTPLEIRAALAREAEAYRERHGLACGNELLPSEKSSIRMRVAVLLGIALVPLPMAIWEGNYAGRERDPAWPAFFERAWEELWFERGQRPPYSLCERAALGHRIGASALILVEDRAAAMLQSYARSPRVNATDAR